jgi:hypothetical protein
MNNPDSNSRFTLPISVEVYLITAVLSWLTNPGDPLVTVLSLLTYPGDHLVAVL